MRKIISKELDDLSKTIDRKLHEYLDIKNVYQQKVYDSMNYSLFTGGKRLRPIICIKTFELFNPNIDKILPFASAIEMIHTYSLIHDDLPSMDNDKYRRGKLTNHMVFGQALAILSGDGLLNLAYEIMLKETLSNAKTVEDYKDYINVIELIANYAGVSGMIGGQVVDLIGSDEDMDRDKLKFMYDSKTSALFEASVLTGAILGGANLSEIQIMHEFSKCIGLSYQIKDDFLDIDEDADKFTFLNSNGEDKALTKLNSLTEDAIDHLDKLQDKDTRFLKDLTKILLNRNK